MNPAEVPGMSEDAGVDPDAGGDKGSRVKINEIFYSLQGESSSVGVPTVFVRLTGCPLRCSYCDTEYAFHEGKWLSIEDVLQRVETYAARYVTVTGGEPLAHRSCPVLLKRLCDAGYRVSLETSGFFPIAGVDARVVRVMDMKTPASGEMESNRYENVADLRECDQVKFVICDRADFEWAVERVSEYRLTERCEVLFSPEWERQDATQLAQWILDEKAPVRFQIQLHKVLWGDERGR